jgi:hypothetical protein
MHGRARYAGYQAKGCKEMQDANIEKKIETVEVNQPGFLGFMATKNRHGLIEPAKTPAETAGGGLTSSGCLA